ncbi:alkaline phosphatase family protein [Nocardia brasiliensis]
MIPSHGVRRLFLAAVISASVVLSVASPAAAAPPVNKVVVIGVDGTLFSEVLAANAPNLQRLAQQGALSRYSIAPHTTVSCPSWATVLTGVWDTEHGITDNGGTCTPQRFAAYPTMFTLAKNAAPNLRTAAIVNWNTIGMMARTGTPADTVVTTQIDPSGAGTCDSVADTKAAAADVRAIEDGTDLLFTHFDQVDIAGHTLRGVWPQAYRDAIARVDRLVGTVVAAVDQRSATHPDERWTVLITTDHGHKPAGGHGGQSAYETAGFVIAKGPDFAAGSTDNGLTLVDVTPTVLDLLGVPAPANLRGRSMRVGGSGGPALPPPNIPVIEAGITGSSSGSASAAQLNNPLCALASGSAGVRDSDEH